MIESGSLQEYGKDLTVLVPEFIAKKREMQELYKVQGAAAGYANHAVTDTVAQCVIAMSTWGLDRWEHILGIIPDHSLADERRREALAAKLLSKGTTTADMIKNTAAVFSGGEVDVIEDSANYRFVVRFVGIKGIPNNMPGFLSMLEEIKPAHLTYTLEYRYTVWDETQRKTWNDYKNISWNDVKVKEA